MENLLFRGMKKFKVLLIFHQVFTFCVVKDGFMTFLSLTCVSPVMMHPTVKSREPVFKVSIETVLRYLLESVSPFVLWRMINESGHVQGYQWKM